MGVQPTSRLAGRWVLVTGAGGGLGRATALRLAAEGARVLLTDADEPALAATADAIRAGRGDEGGGRDLATLAGDLLEPAPGRAAAGRATRNCSKRTRSVPQDKVSQRLVSETAVTKRSICAHLHIVGPTGSANGARRQLGSPSHGPRVGHDRHGAQGQPVRSGAHLFEYLYPDMRHGVWARAALYRGLSTLITRRGMTFIDLVPLLSRSARAEREQLLHARGDS
jgi:hypothetical protein